MVVGNSTKSKIYDCIILGAGLVGAVAALRLTRAGLNVAVIEAHKMSQEALPFDGRTTAISYGSAQILKEVGLWDAIESATHPISSIKTFEAGTAFSLHFDQKELSDRDAPMGYMIDNRVLRQTFQEALLDDARLTLKDGMTVQKFQQNEPHIRLTLSNDEVVLAKLVIAAEGRHSPSRAYFGIRVSTREYGHTAVVGLVNHENPHKGTAFEVFHPTGPLAFLPMPDSPKDQQNPPHRSAIVWSSTENVKSMSDDEIISKIYNFFPSLGKLTIKSKLAFYPLSYQKTSSLVAHRYALVGDAAHVMHPVAGQGVNLGWRDAKVLCDKVIKAHTLGLDIGSKRLLCSYNKHRERDQKPLLYVTHSLIKIFGIAPKGPATNALQMARSYGLGLVNRIPPLKRFLMKKAMGV